MTDRASAALSKGTAAPDPLIGRVISGRFKITALIARGGMGKVYRAEQAPLGRICAIKVLNPSYAGEHDPEFHKRFFLEASVASKLTHPNTVTIFDYGRTEDDVYYMAMEYLEGHTLHRAIRDAGYLPEKRVVHIARQICRALREAHSVGVIHRDLKPANIFLVEHGDEADFVKVLDFGLVKNVADKGEDLTQTGMFMGSPKYMAPEQIRGDRVDARTDIYALGIILYEMLTGKVPFDRPSSVNILMAHVHEDPLPMREMNPQISVSAAAEETVAGCMAKNPDRRLRSMDEVLVALKRIGEAPAASTISGLEPTERSSVSAPGLLGSRRSLPVDPPRRSDTPVQVAFPSDSASPGAPRPAAGRGSKAMLVVAVAGAFSVAASIGYVAVRPASSAQPAPQIAPSILVAAPPRATAAATALSSAAPLAAGTSAAPSQRKLHVNTDPDGANVKENGVELCSATPCDIVYEGEEADPVREHKLTLARPGYRVEMRGVKADDSGVNVKLIPMPRPAAPAKADMPAVPTGYKADIPY
jgi:eukaryotic-like serine/threonine-protein kinase